MEAIRGSTVWQPQFAAARDGALFRKLPNWGRECRVTDVWVDFHFFIITFDGHSMGVGE